MIFGRAMMAAVLAASLAAGCTRTQYVYVNGTESVVVSSKHERVRIRAEDMAPAGDASITLVGGWRGEGDWDGLARDADWLALAVVRQSGPGTWNAAIPMKDVTGLPADPNAQMLAFSIQRDAGMLAFTGRFNGHRASGRLEFTPAEEYSSRLAELTRQRPTLEQSWRLMLHNVRIDYVRGICEAGFTPSIDEAIQLSNSGIRPDYAREMKAAIPAASVAELIKLSNSGITARYAAGLRDAGYDLACDQVIKLAHSGITPDYAKAVRDAGYGKESIDEVVRFGHSGISISYLQSIHAAGYDLPASDMIKLCQSGVSSSYARTIREAGYHFSAADLIKLAHSGVSTRYLIALHDPDRENLPADEIIHLCQSGVRADVVKRLRKR